MNGMATPQITLNFRFHSSLPRAFNNFPFFLWFMPLLSTLLPLWSYPPCSPRPPTKVNIVMPLIEPAPLHVVEVQSSASTTPSHLLGPADQCPSCLSSFC